LAYCGKQREIQVPGVNHRGVAPNVSPSEDDPHGIADHQRAGHKPALRTLAKFDVWPVGNRTHVIAVAPKAEAEQFMAEVSERMSSLSHRTICTVGCEVDDALERGSIARRVANGRGIVSQQGNILCGAA
jgi:hypothetical protein